MADEDWREAGPYAWLGGASGADLAWEFLRRNPSYAEDFDFLEQDALGGPADANDARLARWGLSFRGRSGAPITRAGDLLAS